MQLSGDCHLHVLKVLTLFGSCFHMSTGSVCLQTTLLKTIVGQDVLCQAINQPDQSKCACTSDYYLVDIEDASHTTYAAIILPANKPVGAGASSGLFYRVWIAGL